MHIPLLNSCYGKSLRLDETKNDPVYRWCVHGEDSTVPFKIGSHVVTCSKYNCVIGVVSGVDMDEKVVYIDECPIYIPSLHFFGRN